MGAETLLPLIREYGAIAVLVVWLLLERAERIKAQNRNEDLTEKMIDRVVPALERSNSTMDKFANALVPRGPQ